MLITSFEAAETPRVLSKRELDAHLNRRPHCCARADFCPGVSPRKSIVPGQPAGRPARRGSARQVAWHGLANCRSGSTRAPHTNAHEGARRGTFPRSLAEPARQLREPLRARVRVPRTSPSDHPCQNPRQPVPLAACGKGVQKLAKFGTTCGNRSCGRTAACS